jgi:WD40 repeat protein
VSPDGEWIASSGKSDHNLIIRSIRNPRTPVQELPISAQATAFSANGRWLATVDGTVINLRSFPNTSRNALQLKNGASVLPESFGFSPDSRWLLTGTFENRGIVNVWDVSDDSPSLTPRFRCMQDDPVRALAFSVDGRYAVTGSHGFQAYLWDLKAPDVCASRRSLGPHKDAVT